MRTIFLSLFICVACLLSAKSFKINQKTDVKPFSIKIEKMEVLPNETVFHIKVKQQNNFSYSIDFEDCYVKTSADSEPIKGELKTWNDDKKIYRTVKTISNEDDEKLTLSFPTIDIPHTQPFTLKIGDIQNRDKTEIIIKDLKTKK